MFKTGNMAILHTRPQRHITGQKLTKHQKGKMKKENHETLGQWRQSMKEEKNDWE